MQRKFLIFGSLILLGIAIAIALTQLPPNWFKPDYLVDLSSILTLISFSVRSMLILRILAIGAQLTFIPYCFFQPTPLWIPIAWNVLFMAVNIINVVKLLLEKRPVVLKPDEQKLYDLAFKTLSPRDFLKLMTLGEWRDGNPGEQIIDRDDQNFYVSILCQGEAVAVFDNHEQVRISEGMLLGIKSVLVGEPTKYCDIELSAPSRYIRWSVVQLKQFTDQHPEIRDKFKSIVSLDLAKLVQKMEKLYLKKMGEPE